MLMEKFHRDGPEFFGMLTNIVEESMFLTPTTIIGVDTILMQLGEE